jgi:hypothetical protein
LLVLFFILSSTFLTIVTSPLAISLLPALCYQSPVNFFISTPSIMSTWTPLAELAPSTPKWLSLKVRKLMCPSWTGGKMQEGALPSKHWNLGFCSAVTPSNNNDTYNNNSDYDQTCVASEGSTITIDSPSSVSNLNLASDNTSSLACDPPSSPEAVRAVNPALIEMPPNERRKIRKSPDDCHILIRWSQLAALVKKNFSCNCGEPIKHFDRQTIGIGTALDFRCQLCNKNASALADWSSYVEQNAEKTFLYRDRRIDNYKMNWPLIMCTQLMGESQIGGSIIGMFLDLMREAFQNSWRPMEDLLGVQQEEIGHQCCNLNLLKEMMGEIVSCMKMSKCGTQLMSLTIWDGKNPRKLMTPSLAMAL